MTAHNQNYRPTRRTLLQAGLGVAAAPALAAAAGFSRTGEPRTLVLLQLAGGNDGLNTVIPYADPLYYEMRPRLSKAADGVLPLNREVGLHGSLAALVPLYESGRLAIIQSVGYEEPDFSHVRSQQIWATGRRAAGSERGWWSAVAERLSGTTRIQAVCMSRQALPMVAAARSARIRMVNAANGSSGRTQAAKVLAEAARLASSDSPPSLIFAVIDGFDTHSDQLGRHAQALHELGDGLAAFQDTVEGAGAGNRVLLAAWSEFGRRIYENVEGGTDHGAAGPMLFLGQNIRGGLYGRTPSLAEHNFGNLAASVDFRAVYAALAANWLACPVTPVSADPALALV